MKDNQLLKELKICWNCKYNISSAFSRSHCEIKDREVDKNDCCHYFESDSNGDV